MEARARCADGGGHQRRHDPRARPVRRLPGGESGRAGTGPGARSAAAVGELDEEMVYETRAGETFLLGASTWRIERITPRPGDRLAGAGPAGQDRRSGTATRPGPADRARPRAGRLHAGRWRARSDGRRARAGRDAGCATTTTSTRLPPRTCSPTWPSRKRATGAVPSDRTIVVERFRDELGDWRVVLLTPFGGRVHAPWALAIGARLRERLGARPVRRSGPTTAS